MAKAAADNATGQEAGVTEKKDLKEDIIFKPFEEVHLITTVELHLRQPVDTLPVFVFIASSY